MLDGQPESGGSAEHTPTNMPDAGAPDYFASGQYTFLNADTVAAVTEYVEPQIGTPFRLSHLRQSLLEAGVEVPLNGKFAEHFTGWRQVVRHALADKGIEGHWVRSTVGRGVEKMPGWVFAEVVTRSEQKPSRQHHATLTDGGAVAHTTTPDTSMPAVETAPPTTVDIEPQPKHDDEVTKAALDMSDNGRSSTQATEQKQPVDSQASAPAARQAATTGSANERPQVARISQRSPVTASSRPRLQSGARARRQGEAGREQGGQLQEYVRDAMGILGVIVETESDAKSSWSVGELQLALSDTAALPAERIHQVMRVLEKIRLFMAISGMDSGATDSIRYVYTSHEAKRLVLTAWVNDDLPRYLHGRFVELARQQQVAKAGASPVGVAHGEQQGNKTKAATRPPTSQPAVDADKTPKTSAPVTRPTSPPALSIPPAQLPSASASERKPAEETEAETSRTIEHMAVEALRVIEPFLNSRQQHGLSANDLVHTIGKEVMSKMHVHKAIKELKALGILVKTPVDKRSHDEKFKLASQEVREELEMWRAEGELGDYLEERIRNALAQAEQGS